MGDNRIIVQTPFAGQSNAVYQAERVTVAPTDTLTLKQATETTIEGALTDTSRLTIVLPTPVSGKVNESILVFKIGASLPSITQPVWIQYWKATPALTINKTWVICYEQIETSAGVWEIIAAAAPTV